MDRVCYISTLCSTFLNSLHSSPPPDLGTVWPIPYSPSGFTGERREEAASVRRTAPYTWLWFTFDAPSDEQNHWGKNSHDLLSVECKARPWVSSFSSHMAHEVDRMASSSPLYWHRSKKSDSSEGHDPKLCPHLASHWSILLLDQSTGSLCKEIMSIREKKEM